MWSGLTKLGLSPTLHWNSKMVEVTCINFSLVCTYPLPSTVQVVNSNVLAILDSFYSVLTVSGELRVAGAGGG